MVETLISLGGSWILWSAHVFVVALEMLVEEVRVHKFGVSPSSGNFVDHFSLVEELVTSDGVKAAEVAPLQAEEEVLDVGLWLQLEPVTVNVHLITHDDEGPNPGHRLKNVETVKWDPESFVHEEGSLTFLRQVLVVFLREQIDYWASQVHEPDWQEQVACVDIYEMCGNDDK